MVHVYSLNQLMWQLDRAGLCTYRAVEDVQEIVRAMQYLDELRQAKTTQPDRAWLHAYDAIYVDEGQDLLEEDYRVLKELCRIEPGGEENLYVFYDDAQNLFGRRRPNWQSLGINMRGGRSFIMTECFRNTRPIVEAAFNVLYGTCAGNDARVPTREFGDIASLQQKGLIEDDAGFWRVRFAPREGPAPSLSIASSLEAENDLIAARLRWLIEQQQVRTQDIQVLAMSQRRAEQLAHVVAGMKLALVRDIHIPFKNKDRALGEEGRPTVSTVASAKGYDACCVLLASANEFTTDIRGRANFYVGCTRAIERLDVFAHEISGLAGEMSAALERISSPPSM